MKFQKLWFSLVLFSYSFTIQSAESFDDNWTDQPSSNEENIFTELQRRAWIKGADTKTTTTTNIDASNGLQTNQGIQLTPPPSDNIDQKSKPNHYRAKLQSHLMKEIAQTLCTYFGYHTFKPGKSYEQIKLEDIQKIKQTIIKMDSDQKSFIVNQWLEEIKPQLQTSKKSEKKQKTISKIIELLDHIKSIIPESDMLIAIKANSNANLELQVIDKSTLPDLIRKNKNRSKEKIFYTENDIIQQIYQNL